MNINSQYLKVGDCILLYAEQCGGFMTAVGYVLFVYYLIFLIHYNRFNMTDVFIQKCTPQTIKLMPNIRNMVFKVMPKLVYDATREYNKEKKAYDDMI